MDVKELKYYRLATSPEQSKELLDLVGKETADMFWWIEEGLIPSLCVWGGSNKTDNENTVWAWSVEALSKLLPSEITAGYLDERGRPIRYFLGGDYKEEVWYKSDLEDWAVPDKTPLTLYYTRSEGGLVNALFDMIIKIKKEIV